MVFNNFMAKILKLKANIGALPYFASECEDGFRQVQFHQPHCVDKFPRLISLLRIEDVLEMNLFLEHRFRGIFMPPKRGGKANSLGGVSLPTLQSIANSLSIFLDWLEDNRVDWREVIAVAATERAKFWLPIYRFRKHLIDRVIAKEVDRDTANLYMNHVRQFYEWAFKNQRIEKIPFEYKTKIIKKYREDGDFDLLFGGFYQQEKGIVVTTTDLLIPKKYKQKKPNPDELSPYKEDELKLPYESEELQKPSVHLWVQLAHICGLRADEAANFPADVVKAPYLFVDTRLFYVPIIGKFQKHRKIAVPKFLMNELWQYLNSTERQKRLEKWQLHYGNVGEVPLFINRSGHVIQSKSVSNVISKVRKELKQQGRTLEKDFHDLRSTFATNLARFLLHKNMPEGFIKFKLMQLLGHDDFSTTSKYIRSAESQKFDELMATWVDKWFGDYQSEFATELKQMQGEPHE